MAIEEILKKLNREMPEAKVKTVTGAIRFFEGELDFIRKCIKDSEKWKEERNKEYWLGRQVSVLKVLGILRQIKDEEKRRRDNGKGKE